MTVEGLPCVTGPTLPCAGCPSFEIDSFTGVRSYAGPVSVHASGIATGCPAFVAIELSGQSGRPSGAQSGVPSHLFEVASCASGIGDRLVPSERAITSSPFEKVPRTYAMRVPSGDQVQLMFPCGSSCEIFVRGPGTGRLVT